MFTETNEIKHIIANIDGLVEIAGKRYVNSFCEFKNDEYYPDANVTEEIKKSISFLHSSYGISIVSTFYKDDIEHIIKSCFDLPSTIKIYPATNSIEQHLVSFQISKAIEEIGSSPCNIVYFCGDIKTLPHAQNRRLGTICWLENDEEDPKITRDLFDAGPDFSVKNYNEMRDIFQKKLIGYFGEVLSTPTDYFIGKATKPYNRAIKLPNDEFEDYPIHVSGRYFKWSDPRTQKHALSLRIVNSKNNMDRQKTLFAQIIGMLILYLCDTKFDYITRIPPKPSQGNDRLADQLEELCNLDFKGKKFIAEKIRPELIECIRDYPSQKEAGDYLYRRENVRGAFKVNGDVNGKTIIIVDDVTTSGSTLKETISILINAGAAKVVPLAIAYHPSNVVGEKTPLKCPNCEGELVPRFRTADGQPFYGCKNYSQTKCKGSISFTEGARAINEHIVTETMEPFEDIDF